MEKAKYIFTDSGIRPKYVKREGQIFVDTWHGTPLKVIKVTIFPKSIGVWEMCSIRFWRLITCFILMISCMKDVINAYMIEKMYPGKILLEGYPRNSVFFDETRRLEVKGQLGLSDMEVFIYMPTFRGILMERNEEGQKDEANLPFTIRLQIEYNRLFMKLIVLNVRSNGLFKVQPCQAISQVLNV